MIIQLREDLEHGVQALPVDELRAQLQALLNTANDEMRMFVDCMTGDGWCDVTHEAAQEAAAELFYFMWAHRDRVKLAIWTDDPAHPQVQDIDIFSVQASQSSGDYYQRKLNK